MNSRIYPPAPVSENKKYIFKKDYFYKEALFYKIGDMIECDGTFFCARAKYHNNKFLIMIKRVDILEFLDTYYHTIAEWRNIQINSILED